MKAEILRFLNSHIPLVIGAGLSFALLILLFIFQFFDSPILNLETRWLLVAGLPLLAALIVGGYIKSFKGFGVELEASISRPVTRIDLVATEAMDEVLGDEKRSIGYLDRLSPNKKRNIGRLIITQGRVGYYSNYAIAEYLESLPKLEYMEIRTNDGMFYALLPTRVFRERREIDRNEIERFLSALEDSMIDALYGDKLLKDSISEDTRIIEAVEIMREKNLTRIAVLKGNREFVGLLLASKAEKTVVDQVLAARASA